MNITKKIEELRKRKKWSVARLAREAEIPTVSLRVMLSREDVNNYNIIPLIKIADALGTTVSELTKDNDTIEQIPKLNTEQKQMLKEAINETVNNFFSVTKDNSTEDTEEPKPDNGVDKSREAEETNK